MWCCLHSAGRWIVNTAQYNFILIQQRGPDADASGPLFRFLLCSQGLLLLCLLGALGFQRQNGIAAAQVDTALLVDVGHLDHDGIAHSHHILHALHTLGVQLGDVHQTFLARCDLNEGTKVHQAGHFALVDGTDLGVLHNGLDGKDGTLCVLLIHSRDEHMAVLLHVDLAVAGSADVLDDLAALADHVLDLVGGDHHAEHLGSVAAQLMAGYPPDPQEYKELLNSTQCIKRWSAAPELDGALVFGKYASAHGVLVSLAHTTADYLQVKKAYEAGFTHATHFYNAMTSVHKDREYKHEGTVEGIYLMKDMTVEVVADGIHVPPAILKLVYQIKGVERTSLITDAMAAATCDNGTEHFPDSRVIIEEGVCKLADRSAIAGSIATGIRLIRTLVEKAEIPLHDAVRMASESPARLMGILDRKGTLEKGKDADIIIFNNDIEIQETFIEGKRLSKE